MILRSTKRVKWHEDKEENKLISALSTGHSVAGALVDLNLSEMDPQKKKLLGGIAKVCS